MSRRAAWLMRIALFGVYFWFGILKLLGLSPATQLVHDLFAITVPFLTFGTFSLLFAVFEVAIGVSYLLPRLARVSFVATLLHLACTVLPLFLLHESSWHGFLVPTLEGQYIIKNVLILACAYALFSQYRASGKRGR